MERYQRPRHHIQYGGIYETGVERSAFPDLQATQTAVPIGVPSLSFGFEPWQKRISVLLCLLAVTCLICSDRDFLSSPEGLLQVSGVYCCGVEAWHAGWGDP